MPYRRKKSPYWWVSIELPSGQRVRRSTETASKKEADRMFARLTDGGAVIMPLQDTFWGSYFGQGTDKFGVQWMVNVESSGD